MYAPNLDLLRTGPYRPDGRAKDPHGHQRAEHLAALAAARRARWTRRLGALRAAMWKFGLRRGKARAVG
jgi:hypothetical protein